MERYLNISGYQFVAIDDTESLEKTFRNKCNELDIKGTILIAHEGINVSLAGSEKNIRAFQQFLEEDQRFQGIFFKDSYSENIPFKKLRIRLKKEIISMGIEHIDPNKMTGQYISPEELEQWYREQKDFCILDTRNDYEIRVGTFEHSIDVNIHNFRDFPKAIQQLPESVRNKPVVTFCTGGVRCEKASALLLENGFSNVYQLEGGIINYFEKCGGKHWDGECFVFDDRVAVDKELQPSKKHYCLACLHELTHHDLQHPHYIENQACHYCFPQYHNAEPVDHQDIHA